MLAAGGSVGTPDPVRDVLGEGDDRDRPRCDGITGVSVGVADDGDPLIVLVLAQDDEDAATGNAGVVRDALEDGDDLVSQRPWSDFFSVEDVTADGTVVVATLRPAGGPLARWTQFLLARSFPPC
jgi:hypothetical protein